MKRRTDSAFPLGDGRTPAEDGLTKREFLAALVLHNFCPDVLVLQEEDARRAAASAVMAADALLAELKKEKS